MEELIYNGFSYADILLLDSNLKQHTTLFENIAVKLSDYFKNNIKEIEKRLKCALKHFLISRI